MLQKFKRLIFSSTAKNTTTLFTGNVTSSILAIIFTILAARALGPESWGLVAAVGSLIGILVAVGELGLDASLLKFTPKLLKEKNFDKARNLFQLVFTLRIISALTYSFILLIFSRQISMLIFKQPSPDLAIFSAIGLLGALVLDYQITALQAKQSWGKTAITITLTNIIRIILITILIFTGSVSLTSILLIFTTSSIIGFFVSLLWHRTQPKLPKSWKPDLLEVASFSGWMGMNKIASAISSRMDVILLIQLAGPFDAGIYAAANRLAMGVPIFVGSFATVLAPRLSSFDDKKGLHAYFHKSVLMSLVLVLGLIFGIIVSPRVISLFGSDYTESTRVLQLLLASYIPFAVATPAVNALIYAFKKPQIIAITTLVQLPLVLVINIVLIPSIGVFAPVIAISIVNITTMLISYIFVFRYL